MRFMLLTTLTVVALNIGTPAKAQEDQQGVAEIQLKEAISQLEENAPNAQIRSASARLREAYEATELEEQAYRDTSTRAFQIAEEAHATAAEVDDYETRQMRDIDAAETAESAEEAYGLAYAAAAQYETARETLAREMDNFVETIRNASLEQPYKSPAFQCLEDYDKCFQDRNMAICFPLYVVCLAAEIVPG